MVPPVTRYSRTKPIYSSSTRNISRSVAALTARQYRARKKKELVALRTQLFAALSEIKRLNDLYNATKCALVNLNNRLIGFQAKYRPCSCSSSDFEIPYHPDEVDRPGSIDQYSLDLDPFREIDCSLDVIDPLINE
ncbi:hypothetical protein P879_06019 [Paragonimus westermani]|uniref:BZIP domain-containing protein n=1 Tax=Paragonimus westermani TaxID=34504 RepID=A0A8T0DPF9_9TREM|nr:hypothetical protein P879_06019 [Paragonimus westermani]